MHTYIHILAPLTFTCMYACAKGLEVNRDFYWGGMALGFNLWASHLLGRYFTARASRTAILLWWVLLTWCFMNNLTDGGFEMQFSSSLPLNYLGIQVWNPGTGILLLLLSQAWAAAHYFFVCVILGFELTSVISFMYILIMEWRHLNIAYIYKFVTVNYLICVKDNGTFTMLKAVRTFMGSW
jgi:hypothetical protein